MASVDVKQHERRGAKAGWAGEKNNEKVHILAANTAVLQSVSGTVSLSSPIIIQNQAPIYCPMHQLHAHCHYPVKVYVLYPALQETSIFFGQTIVIWPARMSKQCRGTDSSLLSLGCVRFKTGFSLAVFQDNESTAGETRGWFHRCHKHNCEEQRHQEHNCEEQRIHSVV